MVKQGAFVLAVIALTAACGKKEAEERAAAAEAKVVQLAAVSTAKDSLMKELMSTTTFISGINEELSKVKPAKGASTVVYEEKVIPVAEYRAALMSRIKELTSRVDESESRLAATQARLRTLAGRDRDMIARIAAYDSMVAEYRTVMEGQRTQIAELTSQVETLQADNQRLAAEKTQLTEEKTTLTAQVNDLTTFANTVYYVLGSKKELLAKGIVAEAGGSRVLGIGWKTGKTLVPGRDLSEAEFQRATKDAVVEIALPNAEKKYRLVSPQNVNALETKPAKDGTFRGTLKISNPEAFWAPSKYLILVEG